MAYFKTNADGSADQVSQPSYLGGILTIIGNALKTAYIKLAGYVKVDYRPAIATALNSYALQVRSVSGLTTGTHTGIDSETHLGATGAANIRGVQGVAVLDTGFTATAVTLIGAYAQARADGDVAGASFIAALYGLVEAGKAITATHVTSLWLDSHQANAVTGEHDLMYLTNNGAAQMDQVMNIYGNNAITALMSLNTCGGMVAATAETGGSSKKIKIVIDGVVHFINA
jgi:hypothetical protein